MSSRNGMDIHSQKQKGTKLKKVPLQGRAIKSKTDNILAYKANNVYKIIMDFKLILKGMANVPASFKVLHFWYMDVLKVGALTLYSPIFSIRESKTRSKGSFSSHWDIILLSIKVANICVSMKRERNGRCGSGWSHRKEACNEIIKKLLGQRDPPQYNMINPKNICC